MLLSIDGQRITTLDQMKALLYDYEVGQTVETVIYRSGERYQVTLTLSEFKG